MMNPEPQSLWIRKIRPGRSGVEVERVTDEGIVIFRSCTGKRRRYGLKREDFLERFMPREEMS